MNDTEKSGKPRTFKISEKLVSMLKRLDMTNEKVFGKATYKGLETHFTQIRKRLAHKLQNPRLLRISFHTFRHWRTTMEYHKTKDLLPRYAIAWTPKHRNHTNIHSTCKL
ncbi:MAG: hypothetical protein C0193_02435 [Candidatus Bathyarchaeota archaeon]|nr:MAG: hypothetical protein C0193_02435 [Candidatus Bathyarchaeota archaeon]